jgi:hypothetical protein
MHWAGIVVFAIAMGIRYAIKQSSGGSDMDRLLRNRGGVRDGSAHHLIRDGVQVTVRRLGDRRAYVAPTEATAGVLVPPGLRFLRRRNWGTRGVPAVLAELDKAPQIDHNDEGILRSDTLTALPPLPDLATAWNTLMRTEATLLGCTGTRVVARLDQPADTDDVLDALINGVVAVARWDNGFGDALAALPGAERLVDHELAPGVSFPDGLVLGVRDGTTLLAQLDAARGSATATVGRSGVVTDGDLPAACVAALARAGEGTLVAGDNGARFTWATIERDPARHRAAIEALRALAAQGPYR